MNRSFKKLLVCGILMGATIPPGTILAQAGLSINPEALWTTGQVYSGAYMLPTGRLVTPPGSQVTVSSVPLNMVLSPDNKFAVISSTGPGQHQIQVIDLALKKVVDSESAESLWLGLAFSPDGTTLYASNGGTDQVLVYDFNGGLLTLSDTWNVDGHPAGIDVSPDGSELLVVSNIDSVVTRLDAVTGASLGSVSVDEDPISALFDVGDPTIAYVAEQRDSTVAVIDLSTSRPTVLTRIRAKQKAPDAMAMTSDGATLYIANSDQDTVTVVDTATYTITRNIDLRAIPNGEVGASPNNLEFSPDGKRLYVSQGLLNRVGVVDVASGNVLGYIPTGWMPTAVRVSSDNKTLVIANAKGTGGTNKSLSNPGSVSITSVPADTALPAMTASVTTNNSYPSNLFTTNASSWNNPVPRTRGAPSTVIKHVVLMVRENKTYDSVLGDYEPANGDPTRCIYCDDATPNLHALAQRFSLADNYYNSVEESDQGHMRLTSTTVNMYSERITWTEGRAPMFMEIFLNPSAWPSKNFIFQNAIEHNVGLRIYGEAIGTGVDWLLFDRDYVHWGRKDPPFFWMFSKDVDKLAERIEKDWDQGVFPSFVYMLFPNDHTNGCQFPFPTPISMVADNDEAVGQFMEWLRNSPYWNDTIVFSVEDDPQTGTDHIDFHRGPMYVMGRYAKRNYVSSIRYNEANLHATIEYILNLPPMSTNDEVAQPMWDMFTSTPDDTPYVHIPRIIPEERANRPGTNCAVESAKIDFSHPDDSPELGNILVEFERARRAGNPNNPTGMVDGRSK